MGEHNYRRLVVKLGTSTLTSGTTHISESRLGNLVRQMADIRASGCEVILVSSGAMAAGREALAFPDLPKEIPEKQMLAAVGQPRLMALYENLFALHGYTVAQVLLTRGDLARRPSYLNARNTLRALLNQNVIPVVNENDAVTTEEIRVGDNDNLSALVANLIDADILLMLTDQPGLFTADPRHDSEATLVSEVSGVEIPEEIWQAAGHTADSLGTGGMVTKLEAADLARRSGATVVIADGSDANVITEAVRGEAVGTRFPALVTTIESRKRFILSGGDGVGSVQIDAGAAQALLTGSSLLPVGVTLVSGEFDRGDTISVIDAGGHVIAHGLASYQASELNKIAGRHSKEIESILGYAYGEEAIHRDQLMLLPRNQENQE